LKESEAEKVQDLLCLAVNQAIRDSQALAARRLGPLAKGLTGLGSGK
jgi:DNA-binding protein YbaB